MAVRMSLDLDIFTWISGADFCVGLSDSVRWENARVGIAFIYPSLPFTCAGVLMAASSRLEPKTDVSCPGKASLGPSADSRSIGSGRDRGKTSALVTLPAARGTDMILRGAFELNLRFYGLAK